MSSTQNNTWAERIEYFEYTSAVNPEMPGIEVDVFPASLHTISESTVIPLDLSSRMGVDYPCTGPSLLANYVHISPGDAIQTSARASSQVFYCIRGSGYSESPEGVITWKKGDYFGVPGSWEMKHVATDDSAFYWVNDGPLLGYLGVVSSESRFRPVFYSAESLADALAKVRAENEGRNRNRNGILLANSDCPRTKTVTHTLWSLYNLLPRQSRQKAHRHNSIALDFCVTAGENTYTLIGKKLDDEGNIIDPIRAAWSPGAVFVTPPGWWHSHHNESDEDAIVLPIQDAALHTHIQTLDIQFSRGY
ncbi:MAG: hypothetical protein KDN22_09715 [Verrucomicrobiae bacterium]|nr:hypothetical protein [Verrucomicrobiae bacterium]